MLFPISKRLSDFVRLRVRLGVIHLTNPLDLGDIFDKESYLEVAEAVFQEEQVERILLQHTFSRNVGIEDIWKPIQAIQQLPQ
jgi:acyl-CoA synthetase (NDP forming)